MLYTTYITDITPQAYKERSSTVCYFFLAISGVAQDISDMFGNCRHTPR